MFVHYSSIFWRKTQSNCASLSCFGSSRSKARRPRRRWARTPRLAFARWSVRRGTPYAAPRSLSHLLAPRVACASATSRLPSTLAQRRHRRTPLPALPSVSPARAALSSTPARPRCPLMCACSPSLFRCRYPVHSRAVSLRLAVASSGRGHLPAIDASLHPPLPIPWFTGPSTETELAQFVGTSPTAAAPLWPPASCSPESPPPCPTRQIEPLLTLDLFPVLPRPRAPASSPELAHPRRPAAPRGHIAKPTIFLGSLLQKVNSNSKTLRLFLVNCIENRRKIRKMQNQLC
jgi:hypothetical protein